MGGEKRRSGWNYRIMRHVEKTADNDETYYAMHEVYYDADNRVTSWTEEPTGSPFGETLEEMTNDLAWILAGLTKPVLDFANGQEIGPAAMLADDLSKMLRDRSKAKAASRAALSPAGHGGRDE